MGVTGPTRLAGLADELLRCAVYATALAARRLASGESDGGWPSAEPRAGRLQGGCKALRCLSFLNSKATWSLHGDKRSETLLAAAIRCKAKPAGRRPATRARVINGARYAGRPPTAVGFLF